MSHYQLVVLGGGPGGYAAAFRAADLGMQVALIERDPQLGGTCLLRGCIPSKALLHVAEVLHEAQGLADWGIEFGTPQIHLERIRARRDKIITTLSSGLKHLAKQRKVTVICARASFENSTTLLLTGDDPSLAENHRIRFDHCILAVGSSPTKIPAFEIGSERVMDSTGGLMLAEIPPRLLVIGGGYIGLELGSVYASLGSKVDVVELTPGLLPGADRDLVKPLQARLQKELHAIRLQTKVTSLVDLKTCIEATLEGPSGEIRERYDRVLVSVGRRPNSQGIGLENTGVKIDAKGFVQVDRQQRTSDPHVLAIGDVCGEPMLAHKASYEGKLAAEVLHGEPVAFDAQVIPAVVFTDPEIAWVGLTEDQAKQSGQNVEIARFPWAASGKAQSLGRTEGMTKLILDGESNRVLGVGIVGQRAGDLISEGALAIEMGATAEDVASTIHPHPTLSETIPFAGEVYFGSATEIFRPVRDR